MNYEDMSDFEINKAVAFRIRGRDAVCVIDTSLSKLVRIFNGNSKREKGSGWVDFDPCNAWNDAGPIIVENKITVGNYDGDGIACCNFRGGCHEELWDFEVMNKNPLRAAMICFLKMKDAEK